MIRYPVANLGPATGMSGARVRAGVTQFVRVPGADAGASEGAPLFGARESYGPAGPFRPAGLGRPSLG